MASKAQRNSKLNLKLRAAARNGDCERCESIIAQATRLRNVAIDLKGAIFYAAKHAPCAREICILIHKQARQFSQECALACAQRMLEGAVRRTDALEASETLEVALRPTGTKSLELCQLARELALPAILNYNKMLYHAAKANSRAMCIQAREWASLDTRAELDYRRGLYGAAKAKVRMGSENSCGELLREWGLSAGAF